MESALFNCSSEYYYDNYNFEISEDEEFEKYLKKKKKKGLLNNLYEKALNKIIIDTENIIDINSVDEKIEKVNFLEEKNDSECLDDINIFLKKSNCKNMFSKKNDKSDILLPKKRHNNQIFVCEDIKKKNNISSNENKKNIIHNIKANKQINYSFSDNSSNEQDNKHVNNVNEYLNDNNNYINIKDKNIISDNKYENSKDDIINNFKKDLCNGLKNYFNNIFKNVNNDSSNDYNDDEKIKDYNSLKLKNNIDEDTKEHYEIKYKNNNVFLWNKNHDNNLLNINNNIKYNENYKDYKIENNFDNKNMLNHNITYSTNNDLNKINDNEKINKHINKKQSKKTLFKNKLGLQQNKVTNNNNNVLLSLKNVRTNKNDTLEKKKFHFYDKDIYKKKEYINTYNKKNGLHKFIKTTDFIFNNNGNFNDINDSQQKEKNKEIKDDFNFVHFQKNVNNNKILNNIFL